MTRHSKLLAIGLTAACGALGAIVGSCSDSSTGSASGKAATIDATAVSNGLAQISIIIPVCDPNAMPNPGFANDPRTGRPSWLMQLAQGRLQQRLTASIRVASLTGTQPADQLGTCGGRITYPSYSHSNGVTTGTYEFQDYCSLDTDTGIKEYVDGTISFVNTGTPSATGPITNKIDADSPGGVTFLTKNNAGQQLTSQTFAFTDYQYTAGVPGGTPTAGNPNTLKFKELKLTDNVQHKTYTESDYTMSVSDNAAGSETISISGRGHRSNGDYYDMTTTTPYVTDSQGNTVSGAFTFAGANNTKAVMTLVPGATLQATMTVNGTPVTGGPACK